MGNIVKHSINKYRMNNEMKEGRKGGREREREVGKRRKDSESKKEKNRRKQGVCISTLSWKFTRKDGTVEHKIKISYASLGSSSHL
jgi:hypothetical protein